MNIVENYLNFLQEQRFGVQPALPVQNPQAGRVVVANPAVPMAPQNPVAPQYKQPSQQNLNTVQKRAKKEAEQQKTRKHPIQYFNYMVWTTRIIKQGEIFRQNCYTDNCSQYDVGTGKRRLCKDRCDIETCKKIIKLLQISKSKCKDSETPDKCKVRYMQLIPLYQEKLNSISRKYIIQTNKAPETPSVG